MNRRILKKLFMEGNTLGRHLAFVFTADHSRPAILLFFFPFFLLEFPVFTNITPHVEVDVKVISGSPVKSTNQQAHMLCGNKKAEKPILQIGNMKLSRRATQATMKSHSN
jgi:hypothetical protein